jgi:hypothetical protein
MRRTLVALAAAAGLLIALAAGAGTEENAEDFMALHRVEIAFHEGGYDEKPRPDAVIVR